MKTTLHTLDRPQYINSITNI